MRAIICIFLFIGVFNVNAQKNIFLEGKFWSEKTTVEEVQTAIENGNNPTAFNSSNFDATAYAILNNAPIETIQFLLDIKGNEVSKITHDGRNYLMWAGSKGNYELIKILIEKGSDINIVDDKGSNLLTFTASGGVTDHRIYDFYVQSGLDLNTPHRNGANIIHFLAQQVDNIRAFDYFLAKGLSLDAKDKVGSTVFHYASSQGNIELLEQLIAEGLNANAINDNNENALFFAAKGKRRFSNELPVFEYLIQLGLDVKLTNEEGSNVLHYLANGNRNETVFNYLIQQDVDVQKVNNEGNTPLMNAVIRNNKVGISALFERSNDIKIINDKGHNLLTYAMRNKNQELTEELLKKNADYTLIDASGDNLITHLVTTFQPDGLNFFNQYYTYLVNKGIAVQSHTIHQATIMENEFLVNKILTSGVDINAKNKDGVTPLQLAAMKGDHTEFLRFLIDKGADKTILTDFDESVYDLAKSNELLEGDLEFLK